MSISATYLRKHIDQITNINPLAIKQDSAWRILSHMEHLEVLPGNDSSMRLMDWELGRKFSPQEMGAIVAFAQDWLNREAIAAVASAIQEGERESI